MALFDLPDARPFMTNPAPEKKKVDVYARFLPELIIENVFAGSLADQADQEQFNCAVMFADISGFTPLAESFASEGAVGAEKLTATLNDYFSHLVGIIQTHGGDVVKFAGDAVLAIWRDGAEDGDLAYASWRAAQCGLAIQEALRSYTAGSVSLSLRVAIGAGSVNIIHVGGVFGRWEFLVAGKPLEQVGLVSDLIEPGTVGISSQVEQLLKQHTDADPKGIDLGDDILGLTSLAPLAARRNRPELVLEDNQSGLLRSYLPAAVTHRLDANLDAYIGELRRLTILFVNLPDIDYQTPVAQAQEIMIALQESCYRFEGSINKLSVDDKGVSLLAALGLPPLAHEDDPDRGLKAALTINQRLEKLGVRSSVGVSTGRVYCGVVGSDERREYTIMGDSVNLSARLMQNANGGVLCDEATFRRTSADVEFAPPRQIKLKGKAVPEQVHQPLEINKAAQGHSSGPLIGRVSEKRILQEQLRLLEEGASRVVFLEAEAGYGKSRLTEDFVDSIPDGIGVYQAAADAIESSTAHFAIRELLQKVLGLTPGTSGEAARLLVLEKLDGELLELLPLLDSILPMGVSETPFTEQIEGEARATQTARLVVEIVKRCTENQKVAIVLEDTHWLDAASWSVVVSLAREIKPLLLLLVTRPVSDPGREMKLLLADANCLRIQMDRMSNEDILQLVCARLGVQQLAEKITQLIFERTEGHPYFSEELAYALRDAGIIRVDGGQCILAEGFSDASLDDLNVPESIEGIITSRIDRLSPDQAMTIKVASVIGRSFSLNLLQKLHPVSRGIESLQQDLQVCGNLHLTPLDMPGEDPRYIFKHMITREVSYSLLLNDQSKNLHARLAKQYEQEGNNPDSLLAYHWELAESPEKALCYLLRAVEQALDEFANQDVIVLAERGLKLIDKCRADDFIKGKLLRCLGQALFDLGRLEEAERTLRRSMAALGAPMPGNNLSLALGITRQAIRQFRLAKFGNGKPPIAQEQRRIIEVANTYNQIQLLYYYRSDDSRTVYSAIRGSNLGRESGTVQSALVRNNANLAVVAGLIPHRGLANYYLDLAEGQAAELNHLPTTCWVETVKGTYKNGISLWDESEQHFQAAYAIAFANGDEHLKATIMTAMSKMFVMAGRFQDALDGFESFYEISKNRDDHQAICWSVLGQARCYYRLGRLEDIQPLLDEAKPLLATLPYNQTMEHLSLSSLRKLLDGEVAEAIARLDECIQLLRRPTQVMMIFSCTQLANATLEIKRQKPEFDVRARWRKVMRFMKAYSVFYPIGLPVLNYQQGQYEQLLGNHNRAETYWRQALEESIRIDMPYMVMNSYEALKQLCDGGLEQYQSEYSRAIEKMRLRSSV